MNLTTGKGSRKALRAGDVFTLRLVDGRHLFGRVIEVGIDRAHAPMPDSNLIYVYDVITDGPEVDLGALRPDRLLLPPTYINRLPWSRGYFQTIAHAELTTGDVLDRHCFEVAPGRYVGLGGKPTPRSEPCGIWGLSGYGAVDRRVSRALGLPVHDE